MATEEQYDEIIAPMLAAVAERCKELGISLIARAEWSPTDAGITQIGIDETSSVAQRIAQLAAHCRGNIDSLCIEAMKRFDCSQSMILRGYHLTEKAKAENHGH